MKKQIFIFFITLCLLLLMDLSLYRYGLLDSKFSIYIIIFMAGVLSSLSFVICNERAPNTKDMLTFSLGAIISILVIHALLLFAYEASHSSMHEAMNYFDRLWKNYRVEAVSQYVFKSLLWFFLATFSFFIGGISFFTGLPHLETKRQELLRIANEPCGSERTRNEINMESSTRSKGKI